jgi:hypothetical protein
MTKVSCPCMDRDDETEKECGRYIEQTFNDLQTANYCPVPIITAAMRSIAMMAGQCDPQLPEPHKGNMKAALLEIFEREYTNGQARFNSDYTQDHAH